MGIKDISICITHLLSRFCRFEIDSQYNLSGIHLEILNYHKIWRLERELCKHAINLFNGSIVILWSLIVLSCPVWLESCHESNVGNRLLDCSFT